MKMRQIGLLKIAIFTALPVLATAQNAGRSERVPRHDCHHKPGAPRPNLHTSDLRDEASQLYFDAFGPYPLAAAAFAAGIGQAYNTPPEWRQGAEGYGERIGSAFGIAAVSTTRLYGLADAFKEDTLYYRCECRGLGPRLGYAGARMATASFRFPRSLRRMRVP
jgi:hypothetical protein